MSNSIESVVHRTQNADLYVRACASSRTCVDVPSYASICRSCYTSLSLCICIRIYVRRYIFFYESYAVRTSLMSIIHTLVQLCDVLPCIHVSDIIHDTQLKGIISAVCVVGACVVFTVVLVFEVCDRISET